MSKYQSLWEYIAKNNVTQISFSLAKEILGFEIDHSFLTYKKELLSYGYEVQKISLKEKIIFIKKNS